MTKMLQLGEQHVDAGEPIVKKERKKENRRQKPCGLLFLLSDLPVHVLYFFTSFMLFFSLFVLKRVEPSLQSNSYVKSFHIGIYLIKSAEGTHLH